MNLQCIELQSFPALKVYLPGLNSIAAILLKRIGRTSVQFSCSLSPAPKIFFANHSSLADYPLIWSSLPAELRDHVAPVAARDYWNSNSLRRFFAVRVFRAVLIERRRPNQHCNPLEPMIAALARGQSLVLFPEGTRSVDGAIGDFQAGLFHLCRACPGIEAVPVYLDNLDRILPKGKSLPSLQKSRIVFGKPMQIQQTEGRQSFLTRARMAVIGLAGA